MKYFITGGAGFIGSNFVNHIVQNSDHEVTIYDNFLTGKKWHILKNINNPHLKIVEADIHEKEKLNNAIVGHDIVYHFASNADIAAAIINPGIDFYNGTVLTFNVLEAMRLQGLKRIVFTSGSGVYGEVPPFPIPENFDKMIPISTYGASKLASESLISAYSFMFDITGTVFRFANVVGPNSTHGVTHDFIKRLKRDDNQLKILGDGKQSKPYVHVEDVIKALKLIQHHQKSGYEVYNVGSSDYITVKEIADLIVKHMSLKNVIYHFTGGKGGWKGDIPTYRLDTSKIRELGWKNNYSSKQAVEATIECMLKDMKKGLYAD